MAWTPRSDTGGGNWSVFYRVLARRATKAAALEQAASPAATLTLALDDLVLLGAGVGVVTPFTFGALDASLDSLTSAAFGYSVHLGSAAVTLSALTVSGSGTLRSTSTLSVTLGAATVSGTGRVSLVGSLTGSLGVLTLSSLPITTPVLTQTSSAGTSPFTFDALLNQDNTFAGYTLRVQTSTSSSFTTTIQDISHLLTETEITSGDIDITSNGFDTPSGTFYLRARIERDDGAASGWSNTLTDTISAATAQWAGTNGFDKHNLVTVSGTPRLTVVGSTAGYAYVRSTQSASPNEFVFEYTVGSVVDCRFGMDDRSIDFTSYTGFPGGFSTRGFYLILGTSGSEVWYWNSSGVATNVSFGVSIAAGDIITVIGNKTTKVVKFERWRSGVKTQLGSAGGYTLGTMTGGWYPYHGSNAGGRGTLNTGQSAFTHTLTGSEAAFG